MFRAQSPYREPPVVSEPVALPRIDRMGNRDIVAVFVAILLAAAVRVGWALTHAETFGTELTLVAATALLIPALLVSSRASVS